MFLIALSSNPTSSLAQYEWQEGADTAKQSLGDGLEYRLETSGSFSNEKAPLWLNANIRTEFPRKAEWLPSRLFVASACHRQRSPLGNRVWG